MNLITVENLYKSYGEKILFNNITFGVNEGDKIGIIGVNGTGKSTLLKIIAGVEEPDSGSIIKRNGLKIGYLAQIPDFKPNTSVIQQVFNNDSPIMKLVMEYEEAVWSLDENNNSKELNDKVIELSQKIDRENAWNLESDAKTILTKLGITDFNKDVSILSGGQRKRTAMAGALISPVDVLILDEPTNHIDNSTVEWLENYLQKYSKALIMITHDRYFLDRVVNKTIELNKGNIYTYSGNYSQFLELKAEREELEEASERKRQNFLRNELEWVRRGAQARSTKQKARLERFENISNVKAPDKQTNIEINVGYSRLGKKIIEIENISKSFDGVNVISNFSYTILKNDRIGIIGPNGIGKSTLLNIITGKLRPDTGTVGIGETVKIGVFSQESDELDESIRVIDYIKNTAEYINTLDGKISASQMLEKFLFTPDEQWSYISKLSGGEKRRLYLLNILMATPNLLFLDEPTNDLDIETLTILEDYLESFPGAVITVSHDRYFLDKCVDKIFSFEGNGNIVQYVGGYSDFAEKYNAKIDNTEKAVQAKNKTKKDFNKHSNTLKMTFKEQKEFETINSRIEALENKIDSLKIELDKYATNYVKVQEIHEEIEVSENELDEAMERWIYLNELDEKINNKG